MPKPPKKQVNAPESPIQKPALSRTGRPVVSGRKELRNSVKKYAAEIRKKHGLLEPKAARSVCRHLEYLITPRPRKGRPPEARITKAVEMYERKMADGGNWNEIAKQCIPGYSGFRSVYRRREELRRLQSAVYARRGRRGTNKSLTNQTTE